MINPFLSSHYAWFIWSLLFLTLWFITYCLVKDKASRKEMLMVSFWTSLTGLTEPIFVPAYWNPPTLFDLAQRTGFDIESLIFTFAIGGLVVVAYERITKAKHARVPVLERHSSHHRYHRFTILSMPIIFVLLLAFSHFNPIYSAIIALAAGGIFTWYCRPDLWRKMFVSAGLFLVLYSIFFLTLIMTYPGYVERVWNLPAISGLLIFGIPLEELLFAITFGFMWSSIYEHVTWKTVKNSTVV